MDLYGHVLCPTCRTEFRIRRRLERGARYRYRCKRCGTEAVFELANVRWACERGREELREASAVHARGRRRPAKDEREDASINTRATIDRAYHAAHDTVYDPRPPCHIAPLLRRGVAAPRESSRVSWLRRLMDRKVQHLAVASSF
jgi:predicted Zn finger-like uncharacterized protein